MTLLFLQRITTPTPPEPAKNNKNAPLEVKHHSSSSESDSSGKEDDGSSDDEPELQESPNKTTPEPTSVSAKTHGEKKTNNTVVEKKMKSTWIAMECS